MEALVLAGGLGTRLRDIAPDTPKPMVLIGDKPFLEYLLDKLVGSGFQKIILSVGYRAGVITQHFGRCYKGVDIDYTEESEPLGTGGAIRLGLSRCMEDHVYIFNGDTYLDLEISALEAQWHQNKSPVIVGRFLEDTSRYGRLNSENGAVISFGEKNAAGPGLINAGCYVFHRQQLDAFPLKHKFSIETDYFAKYLPRTRFDIFISKGRFIDIGTPEDYRAAQRILYPRECGVTRNS